MPPSDNLPQLLEKLYSRINYERHIPEQNQFGELKLQNMVQLLKRLDDPHWQYPTIHIAGTKGKGSVSAMIGQVLMESGRLTGVYSSPHLEAINQRIAINGTPISDDDLAESLAEVEQVASQLDADNALLGDSRAVTFFEAITATAFLYFARQQVDAVVLEVGMGGRLDSTNVCRPVLTIVTSISFDHMQHLGNTLAKIAAEKGGIVKTGVPVISGVTADEPAQVIATIAKRQNSPLIQLGSDFDFRSAGLRFQRSDSKPSTHDSADQSPALSQPIESKPEPLEARAVSNPNEFSVWFQQGGELSRFTGLRTRMPGRHQHHNAAICVAACEVLNQLGWQLSSQAVCRGIESAFLPGRTEIVQINPGVMLDVAHNPASIQALVETLQGLPEWLASSRKVLVLAISKDKDHRKILELLLPHFDRVILTQFLNNPRSRDPHNLLELAKKLCQQNGLRVELLPEKAPQDAYRQALKGLDEKGFVCITGSVYLVAELRQIVRLLAAKN
jgi:dihydrofolate synthase/folylpolyglutamate synthase